jgi:diketogulonate reductase-like aldo/keto reductase
MYIPAKKLKNGFEMPMLGIGTWRMSGDYLPGPSSKDEENVQALKRAVDRGITHIDTAEMYASGHEEELVGEAIKGYAREKLFITSKVWPDHLDYDGVISACKASLERLQTSYLDLYLIHWQNPNFPIKETMRAFDDLKKEGLIKNIGVSNFSAEEFEEAQASTKERIVCNQIHYSLISREPVNQGALEYARENDVLITAYRPLEKGALTEKGKNPLIDELCEKYNKTPAQIAINWLITLPNVVTIAKMVDEKHLKENLGALGWEMHQEDIKRLSDSKLPSI